MPTTEYKNIHFICKLKMEAEIACAHTVKLTGPGLIIDKAGVVGDELTYIFDAGEGLIEQDVGIEGPVAGDFKLYGDITSPYFISHDQLKIKKDEINIRILETIADGWYGSTAGCVRSGNIGSVNADGTYVEGNLFYRYTNSTLSGTLSVVKVAGWSGSLATTCKIIKPNGAVVYGNACSMDQIGKFLFYPIEDFRVTSAPSGSIGTSAFRADRTGSASVSTTVKASGLIYSNIMRISPSPYNAPFNQNVGAILDYQAGLTGSGALVAHNPNLTAFPNVTIAYVSGVTFNFSGNLTAPYAGGATANALFSTVGTRDLRIGGVVVGAGNVSLQISP